MNNIKLTANGYISVPKASIDFSFKDGILSGANLNMEVNLHGWTPTKTSKISLER